MAACEVHVYVPSHYACKVAIQVGLHNCWGTCISALAGSWLPMCQLILSGLKGKVPSGGRDLLLYSNRQGRVLSPSSQHHFFIKQRVRHTYILLADFLDITTPSFAHSPTKHSMEYFITTYGNKGFRQVVPLWILQLDASLIQSPSSKISMPTQLAHIYSQK